MTEQTSSPPNETGPKRPRIYLAGPGVFRPDRDDYARGMKEVCAGMGLEGVFPMDAEIPPQDSRAATARAIRSANLELIRGCQGVIAEMSPFRGPGMDGGTAYEMGFAAALGIPVLAWTPNGGEYAARVADLGLREGMDVEDFGLADNLMMACGTADGEVHDRFEDACDAAAELLVGKRSGSL